MFGNCSYNRIGFVDQRTNGDLRVEQICFQKYNYNNVFPNQICILGNARRDVDMTNVNIRKGYCIDNAIEPRPDFKSFCFSGNDFCDVPYLITMPCGPQFGDNTTHENKSFNNKVFWSGSIRTHETRKHFFDFYSTVDDGEFEIVNFTENVYTDGLAPSTYDKYIYNLSKSDIVYVLRGDKPWVNTFFDVLRTGCIPVMVSSMNDYGWENIFENVDDYMLRFDLRLHSMEYIHEQVMLLLKDKSRVLAMKANIRKFYDLFFKHDAKFGFSEFLLAKCIDIYKNDFDVEKVDNKFICSEVLTLKGLDHKL